MILAHSAVETPSYAQELSMERGPDGQKVIRKIDPCLVTREEIIPLRLPDFDQAALWKKVSGLDGEDIARALLAVRDGGQIAIGEARILNDQKKIGKPLIRMMRTNRDGKVVAEVWVPVKNLRHVRDAVLVKDRVIILAEKDDNNDMALINLNGAGELKEEYNIPDRTTLTPVAMTTLRGGETLVVVARAAAPNHPEDYYTVIMWLDKSGRIISRKEYLPGIPSQPEWVGRLPDDTLLVIGRIKTEDGREAGWIMKLSKSGDIMFQRPYARGMDSTFRSAIQTKDGHIIAVGDAIPSDGQDKAAWVAKIDREGNLVWQKYLTGKYIYGARDVIELSDGRVSVLLAGQVSRDGGRDHARVVTLSPPGLVVADESFVEGTHTLPLRLINQNDKRTILGMTETGFTDNNVEDDQKYAAFDLWVMGLAETPPSAYECKSVKPQELDTLP